MEAFCNVLIGHVVDANVFIRSVLVTLRHATAAESTEYALPTLQLVQRLIFILTILTIHF